MTGDEVVALLPRLRLIASTIARDGIDVADLVQEAALALLEGRRRFRNPAVASRSVMLDYFKRYRLSRGSRVARGPHRQRLSAAGWERALAVEDCNGSVDWDELRLRSDEEAVARLLADEGLSQSQAAERLGTTQIRVSHLWRRVVAKVAERWGLTTTMEDG